MEGREQGELYSSSQSNMQNQGPVESYPCELEEEQDIRQETTILENISSQFNEQNLERLVETYSSEIEDEQYIREEATILEDIRESPI